MNSNEDKINNNLNGNTVKPVLQSAPREHSAILLTFIKLPFVFKTFLSGRLRQVLL